MLRKLEQNFTWRDVIDPISKELKMVMAIRQGFGTYYRDLDEDTMKSYNFKLLMLEIVKKFYDFYKLYFNWILEYKFNNYYLTYIYVIGYTSNIKLSSWFKRYAFILNNNIFFLIMDCWISLSERNLFDMTMMVFNNNILKLFYTEFHNLLLNSVYGTLNYIFYHKNIICKNMEKFFHVQWIDWKLKKFDIRKVVVPFKGMNRSSRYRKNFNNIAFEGFRIKVGGRISRKQRASSFLSCFGTVPLNTFSCHMEYAFYTLPLRNSSVTIKMWFNTTTEPLLLINRVSSYKHLFLVAKNEVCDKEHFIRWGNVAKTMPDYDKHYEADFVDVGISTDTENKFLYTNSKSSEEIWYVNDNKWFTEEIDKADLEIEQKFFERRDAKFLTIFRRK